MEELKAVDGTTTHRRGSRPKLDEDVRTYLFTDKSVLAIEHAAEHGGDGASGDV